MYIYDNEKYVYLYMYMYLYIYIYIYIYMLDTSPRQASDTASSVFDTVLLTLFCAGVQIHPVRPLTRFRPSLTRLR